jgi:hypothetical protein
MKKKKREKSPLHFIVMKTYYKIFIVMKNIMLNFRGDETFLGLTLIKIFHLR